MLKGKKIILGITGSIAAYKACYIIRGLIKQGAEVQVVITPAGKEFITPITLSALTSKPVISEFFAQRDGTWNSHVDLGLWADAMLIAPATASTIGKMANGIADNMLITTYLSAKAPVFIAPAMDLDMYAHPSTQKNLDILRSYGNRIIEPATGELASHLVGKGRMEEPENIIRVLDEFFSASAELQGRKIMITAGPTYEKIDPVRFIGNYSSGKMGFALAEECARRGAEVTLIAGPVQLKTQHSRIHRIDVESAQEMYEAAQTCFPTSDVGILCAAVAAAVTAGFHGHGQVCGPAESGDKQGHQERHHGLCLLYQIACLKVGSPGHLGLHDFIGFLHQNGNKSQGNGHHHGNLVDRHPEPLQKTKALLQTVCQLVRRGGQRHDG